MIFKVSLNFDNLNEAVSLYNPKMDITKFSKKNKINICFEMDGNVGGTNFSKDPYFKAYNAATPKDSTAVARIFIDAKPDLYYYPRYTHHTNPRLNRPLWDFKQRDKELIDYICRNIIVKSDIDGKDHSVWENILLGYSVLTGNKIDIPQPDYSKMVYMPTGGQGRKNQPDPNKRI